MTQETATELVRYYLMSHGAECEEIRSYPRYTCFDFKYRGYESGLGCWEELGIIDIKPLIDEGWFNIDIPFRDVDETNPEFNPEEFFKPFLIVLKKYI